jgi:glucan biosynthesis protein C
MTNHTILSPLNNTERVYALDALRGIMMLLGIILHTACTYCLDDLKEAWPIKAPDNSFIFDILVAYIHTFRMPVFFLTSGFFVAMLMYKKGLAGMMGNRTKRILLPFIAGVILISPLVYVAFAYSQIAFKGENLTSVKASNILSGTFPFVLATYHLWFLYFLIIFVFAAWPITIVMQKAPKFNNACILVFSKIINSFWLRILAVSIVVFLFLYWMKDPFYGTSGNWVPMLPSLLLYFFFFLIGWGIFKTDSLNQLKQRPRLQVSLGSLIFLIFVFTPWPSAPWVLPVKEAVSAVFSTLLIFGFLALFLTYFNRISTRMTYLMDAAYWVYLIHLPIVIIIAGLLADSGISVFGTFSIVLVSTTAICFISYHLFVRNSFIGMFLNGKVQKRQVGQLA